MEFQNVSIATARIKGLNMLPYYNEHFCFYAVDFFFEDTSTFIFSNLSVIRVGKNKEEGKCFCDLIRNRFNEANIHDGDKVAVIFGDDGRVQAIGKPGEDAWIDVTDTFAKKTFAELNIVITSLKVF